MKNLDRFSEFKKQSKEDWLNQIEKDLKGKSHSILLGDSSFQPYFHFSDRIEIKIPKSKSDNQWQIAESINCINNQLANRQILEALEGGANSIQLNIKNTWSLADFSEIFESVYLDFISIHFNIISIDFDINTFFEIFKNYLGNISLKPNQISGSIQHEFSEFQFNLFDEFTSIKYTIFKEEKGTDTILSLADLLVKAEHYLANIEGENKRKPLINSIAFSLEINDYFYLNIAKIRAFKILWATILESYHIDFQIFTKVSISTNSIPNENTRLISATNQAISAIVAGIDLIEIQEFNFDPNQFGSGFNKRIARNIQNLLADESGFAHVFDPSNGSYFIENYTRNIVEKVWTEFQKKVN
ncbi:MAG: methylmalonyl-CoA mutase family protein [Bacteroidota bacterium]